MLRRYDGLARRYAAITQFQTDFAFFLPGCSQQRPPVVLCVDMKRKLLAANILWMYGLQGLNYLIPALLLPYLVRTLGVGQYGLIAFAQSIAQYFILATDFGFNFSATRSISLNRENREEVSRIFWTVISIKFLLLFICAAILEAILLLVPALNHNRAIYFAAYLMVAGNAIFPLWLFQGIEQMRSISVYTGLGRLFAASLVVLLVHSPKDTLLATLLLSAGFLFAGLMGITVALRKYVSRFYRPTRRDILTMMSEGRHLFLTTAAVSLYSNTNTFLVGMLAGVEQAGYFSLVDKIIRAVGGIIAPVIQATYPHMVALLSQSREHGLRFIRKITLAALCGGAALGLVLFFKARPLAVLAFAGQSNLTAIRLLHILALFPLLSSVNYVFGVLILIPFGLDKAQSRMLLSIGVGNVLLGLALIPHMGAVGGVTAMMITETIQVFGSIWLIRRHKIHMLEAETPMQQVEGE